MLEKKEYIIQKGSGKASLLNQAWGKDRSSRSDVLCKKDERPGTLLKKTLWDRCFPVNFAKFRRAPFSYSRTLPMAASEAWEKETHT